MRRILATAAACALALAAVSCATNPASGTHHVVFTTVKSEQEQARRDHEEIKRIYGLYQDQAVQDYVQMIGTRVARNTPIADWDQGYGREHESEADRLGLEYAARAGYRPTAMGDTMRMFKAQEAFEINRAKEEGRDPKIYHGVFSDHPAPDERVVEATLGAANITTVPRGGWLDNREEYLKAIAGLPFGSSREQGIVRENRFYHAGMKLTMAFPKGWNVQNERDRLLVTKKKESVMQVTLEKRPEKKSPREFLLQKLRGASVSHGDTLAVPGMDAC